MEEVKIHKDLNTKWQVCRECGCRMKRGKALQNTPECGAHDFPRQEDLRGQTVSMTGTPKIINVWKCEYCGHSIKTT